MLTHRARFTTSQPLFADLDQADLAMIAAAAVEVEAAEGES